MLLLNDVVPTNITAFTTHQEFDFTLKSGEASFSREQTEFFRKQIGFDDVEFINIHQVHGDTIECVDEQNISNWQAPKADALISNVTNVALVVRTADCFPVFLFDPRTGSIGIVHAGWKGTNKHIVSKTIGMMQEKYGVLLKDIKVIFGPGIGSCCYEVGTEFLDYFPNFVEERNQSNYLNLYKANVNDLLNGGVDQSSITNVNLCTCCNKKFYSYRRDGANSGRMVSLIVLHS